MKPKFRLVLSQCIENGVERGLNRAFKHHDNPDRTYIAECIENCVMGEIYEWFDFPDEVINHSSDYN